MHKLFTLELYCLRRSSRKHKVGGRNLAVVTAWALFHPPASATTCRHLESLASGYLPTDQPSKSAMSVADRFTYSSAPIKRVKAVQFSIWDPEEVVRSPSHVEHIRMPKPPLNSTQSDAQRRYSVAKIETSDTYEKGKPKVGGLSDLRMGTNDKGKGGNLCTTDGADAIECPGYFGHIELAKVRCQSLAHSSDGMTFTITCLSQNTV